MFATGITLGSGGSGGIFAPLLLMGAIVGSVFGTGLVTLDIIDTSSISLLVLIGMAAVFAGAAHAPLTASLTTFEMTGEPSLLLPLLITSYVASLIAKHLKPRSVYSMEGPPQPSS